MLGIIQSGTLIGSCGQESFFLKYFFFFLGLMQIVFSLFSTTSNWSMDEREQEQVEEQHIFQGPPCIFLNTFSIFVDGSIWHLSLSVHVLGHGREWRLCQRGKKMTAQTEEHIMQLLGEARKGGPWIYFFRTQRTCGPPSAFTHIEDVGSEKRRMDSIYAIVGAYRAAKRSATPNLSTCSCCC